MKIAVVGAGAIGGYIGAKLFATGEEVWLIARGPHLKAIKHHGIRIYDSGSYITYHPNATDDFQDVGIVDFILLTVKAHSLPTIVTDLNPLIGPDTAIVSAQNGIPWWYFQCHGGPLDGTILDTLDPDGIISSHIASNRIIGSIIYPSTEITSPGKIKHIEGNRLTIGEIDYSLSTRCKSLSVALNKAGFKCRVKKDIRQELWVKLLGNVFFNPVSALTGATLYEIATNTYTLSLAKCVMSEVNTVAVALGISIPISIDQRIEGAMKVGFHKTSMLQDYEAGKLWELESLVGVVIELGNLLGINMPHTRTLYSCAKLLEQKGISSS